MKSIFITATNTEVGKTFTTIKLCKILNDLGYKVGVFKPIETGVKNLPEDGVKLLKASKNKDILLDDVVPIRFSLPAAPFVAKGDKKIDFTKIKSSYKKILQNSDIVLIEGAGGILTPVASDFFMIDFVKFLDIKKTLLVTTNALGSINETLLNISYLENKKIDFVWAINHHKEKREDFEKITLPFYKSYFDEVLYIEELSSWISTHLL